jgi:hypothetical protein
MFGIAELVEKSSSSVSDPFARSSYSGMKMLSLDTDVAIKLFSGEEVCARLCTIPAMPQTRAPKDRAIYPVQITLLLPSRRETMLSQPWMRRLLASCHPLA